MITAALALGSALLVGGIVTPLIRNYAHRVGAVDHALSSRKLHTRPTPRVGGIAIVAAFFVTFIALLCLSSVARGRFAGEPGAMAAIFLGAAGIAALGIYDDLRGATAKLKLLVQFGVAGLAYVAGYQIHAIATPFGAPFQLGWLALPFTVVFVVGVINAVNLIDGLDGLAAGVSVLAGTTFFIAAAMRGDTLTMWISAALIGASLGFLAFNFNPASIFMGDTGSMFLGFVLVLTAIRSHTNADRSVAMAAPILALLVPIGDTLLSMARRALRGVPLFYGDKEHIHHKLLAVGLSHRSAVLVVYAATAALGGAALVVGSLGGGAGVTLGVLVAVVVLACAGLRHLGYFDRARLAGTLVVRKQNLQRRRLMAEVGAQLRSASEEREVWSAVERAVTVLDARWASVELLFDVDGQRRSVKLGDAQKAPPGLLRSRHGLLVDRPERGFLELAWPAAQTKVSRDAEIAIEKLCEQVREALERAVARRSPSTVIPFRPRLVASTSQPVDAASPPDSTNVPKRDAA